MSTTYHAKQQRYARGGGLQVGSVSLRAQRHRVLATRHSTERDFIYVTTQNLGPEQLQQLSEKVGESRTLLVMCIAFRGKPDRWPNLTVKKIPKAVLHRCEWGHDDYSLQVENLPKAPRKPGQMALEFETP